MVQHLPGKPKVLTSNSSTAKIKNNNNDAAVGSDHQIFNTDYT
jgi:hypothetical protein